MYGNDQLFHLLENEVVEKELNQINFRFKIQPQSTRNINCRIHISLQLCVHYKYTNEV